jgi:predicted RNA binding protein YcfA (HicA-like mRNA interferase family)
MLKSRDVIRILRGLGFYVVRQRGSHVCHKHADGRFTLIPKHGNEDISRGLLHQILRETNIPPFSKLL